MSTVLVVKNSAIEGPALLGKLLEQDGFELKIVLATKEKIPEGNYSMALILGAPQSANDDLPYLQHEMEIIRNFTNHRTPVLGICLGSQLIAKAFGARVYRGQKGEIGFFHDLKSSGTDSLFADFANPFTVFHWHNDTFDLPNGATRLAYSDSYENQAFRVGTTVGLQFHLEVDQPSIVSWFDAAKRNNSSIDFDLLTQDVGKHLGTVNKNMEVFYKNFKLAMNL